MEKTGEVHLLDDVVVVLMMVVTTETPTLADCCLVPQIYNAQRFDTPLDGLPRTMAVHDACMALPAFQAAQPSACPDAAA